MCVCVCSFDRSIVNNGRAMYIDSPQLGKLIFKIAHKLAEYCCRDLDGKGAQSVDSIRKSNNHCVMMAK